MPVIACPALRVMVVDDELLLRSGVSEILGVAPDINVVAACGGAEAVETVRSTAPDVVLLDIRMPDVDGLTVLRRLRSLPNPPYVVMLTTFDTDDYLGESLRLGASGFLLKTIHPLELIKAVRALGTGAGCLTAPMRRRLQEEGTRIGRAAGRREMAALSARERQVLVLAMEGLTYAAIGAELHLSPATIKDHMASLVSKLGVENRTQAVVKAALTGLTRTEDAQ
ncbi:response regulator transcription factor [Streptomyces syringium]|uniref:response regulator transcription factor n=1 Tax=Streptomyces syringium TaxID=76729 RepID=UPI0034195D6A